MHQALGATHAEVNSCMARASALWRRPARRSPGADGLIEGFSVAEAKVLPWRCNGIRMAHRRASACRAHCSP